MNYSRTVNISLSWWSGNLTQEQVIYTPGTLDPIRVHSGIVYEGRISQLDLLIDTTYGNTLQLWYQLGSEQFKITDNISINTGRSVVNLLEQLTTARSFLVAPNYTLGATLLAPERLQPQDAISIIGAASERENGSLEQFPLTYWGTVQGNLIDQVDLHTALAGKQDSLTGASGIFTTTDNKTVTFSNGVIISVTN